MHVNHTNHSESPTSDKKLTSLIALSNVPADTTFATTDHSNPDEHLTKISDLPVTPVHDNMANMDLTSTMSDDVREDPNQATSPKKSAGGALKYLPALVLGLAATALVVNRGLSYNRSEKNKKTNIDGEKKRMTAPDDEGNGAKVPPPPGAGGNEDAGTKPATEKISMAWVEVEAPEVKVVNSVTKPVISVTQPALSPSPSAAKLPAQEKTKVPLLGALTGGAGFLLGALSLLSQFPLSDAPERIVQNGIAVDKQMRSLQRARRLSLKRARRQEVTQTNQTTTLDPPVVAEPSDGYSCGYALVPLFLWWLYKKMDKYNSQIPSFDTLWH